MMHFLVRLDFFYIKNRTKSDTRFEKDIFVGNEKESPAYLIYFPESKAIKRVKCVKFADSYQNRKMNRLN